jgi:hypothetical protein
MIKIALLHYHLKPGGVTTVLQRQVEALKRDCRLLMLSGSPPGSHWPVPCKSIPGIGYQNEPALNPDPDNIAQEIIQAIQETWKGGCDVLHVHNPTLAKNRLFLDVLKALQKTGITLFLQIHDFAEDGRPQAYFEGDYPDDCHYSVINARDYRILLNAGLKRKGLHLLPNPVRPLDIDQKLSSGSGDILYPIRAIRRKNIGEALLLSLYFRSNQALSITLPPNSPADITAYQGWKQFSKTNTLNIRFEAGLDNPFEQLVSRSQWVLTTSITEGFGYAFLEAWTANKWVWGRNLPDITRDFTCQGLCLDHLYQQLQVPLTWMDHQLFFTQWKRCILESSRFFGLGCGEMRIDHAIENMQNTGFVDFGQLDEFFQKQILQVLISEPSKKRLLAEINPFLKNPGLPDSSLGRIHHNRQVILDKFNTAVYRENLLKTYRAVLSSPVKHGMDKHRLAASFLNPDTFSLLKWRPYVE